MLNHNTFQYELMGHQFVLMCDNVTAVLALSIVVEKWFKL